MFQSLECVQLLGYIYLRKNKKVMLIIDDILYMVNLIL